MLQFILGDTGNAIGIRVQHAYWNRGAMVKKRPVQDVATQSICRVPAVNEDLNLERTVDGLDVLNGPSGARPVEGLQLIS